MSQDVFEKKHYYLNQLKDFLKQKAKQFKMTTSLQTFPLDVALGSPLFEQVRKSLEQADPDATRETATHKGYTIVRYDPARGDVDTSINEFCLIEGKVRRKLTNSLMLFYLENEGGGVILTYLGLEAENPLFFISAPSETVVIDFLKQRLPENYF